MIEVTNSFTLRLKLLFCSEFAIRSLMGIHTCAACLALSCRLTVPFRDFTLSHAICSELCSFNAGVQHHRATIICKAAVDDVCICRMQISRV